MARSQDTTGLARHHPLTGPSAHLLALGGYLLAAVLFTWPLVLNLGTAIPGDSFDGWQNYWNQWWIKVALVDRLVSPLFTDLLYSPTGVGLYFHTLNPFNGLTTLPIQLTAGLIPAYNAVVFLSWVLAGYGMFLLVRWLMTATGDAKRGSTPAAHVLAPFLAGLVYTLSPFHMAHLLGHMQVMSLEWLPFYVLYLLRGLQQSRRGQAWLRSSLLAGFFLALNGLCDWYFVLYLFLFTGLAVLWSWLAGDGHHLWKSLKPALVAGGCFAVLLSPWLLPMIQEATQFRFMVRPSADLYILSASVMDFFVPNRLQPLFRPDSFAWIGNQIAPLSERTIALGYIPLALAIATLFTVRRQAAFWWGSALFFFMLALGPQWHWGNITWDDIPPAVMQGQDVPSWTPYGILNQLIPFMRISRSVSRFALMVQFSVAVLAGLGLAALVERLTATRLAAPVLRWLAPGLVILLLAEFWVAPYPLSPPDTPAYYTQLAADSDPRAVLNLPMNYDRPGYLLYQTVHGKPLTVAYISRDDPRTLTERVPLLQHFRHLGPDILDVDPAKVGLTVLADLDVGTVVLDRYKMPGGQEREYTEALAGQIFAGQRPVFADERITVYKTPAMDASQPYLRLGTQGWGAFVPGEDGPAYRLLTGAPAAVDVVHAASDVRLRIQYRTDKGVGGHVWAPDGVTALAVLPAAPDGASVVIHLAPQPGTSAAGMQLEPDVAGGVYVERLALE